MAPAAKRAKAKAAPAGAAGGRGKRRAPPEPPQVGLLKWFAPKAAAAAGGEGAGTPADSQGSGAGGGEGAASEASGPSQVPPEDGAAGAAGRGEGAPAEDGAPAGVQDDGIHAERQDFCDAWSNNKFSRGPCNWLCQYNSSYASRLQKLRPQVEVQARAAWPHANLLPAIKGYRRCHWGTEVVLVGVLFKDMKLRPNYAVLYRDSGLLAGGPLKDATPAGRGALCSDGDAVWLEDGTTRLELALPAERCAELATGFVVAVRGVAAGDGRFEVRGLGLARVPPPPPLVLGAPRAPPADGDSAPFLALASGLALGARGAGAAEARARAVDFLVQTRCVRRLVICGGLLAREAAATGGQEPGACSAALEEADDLLATLAAVLPVDVMPGPHDPTNLSLPQLPLHPYLFHRVRRCRSFRSVSNPYECSLRGGFRVLGHSGQPVEDLLRCTRLASPLQALQCSLEALHLAPTAPDSLPARPCDSGDPFVVDAVPHVLFSGGHDAEDHRWCAPAQEGAGTMCVCVPAFHVSPELVLVSLHDPREVRVPHFGGREPRK